MVNLNDPRRADARGWGSMWAPGRPPRSDMVPLVVDSISFVGGVHPKLVALAEILLTESVTRGYDIHRTPTQTWGFAWRAIRFSSPPVPTNHSSGTAIDINSAYNYLGRSDGGDIPGWMPVMFNRYGFRWGGDYHDRKDPMHFEFMGTPADAAILLALAEEEFMGLTKEEKEQLAQVSAFLDSVRGPLRPGQDVATAKGAGDRVAKAVLAVERDNTDPDGTDH